MKSKKLLTLLVAPLFAVAIMFAAETKSAAKVADCCAAAAKDGKACGHACCVEAAKAGNNCTKCGGSGVAPKKEVKK